MGSSEVVDSGRSSVVRSNFSQTCNRLSQYLKENGSFADLSIGLSQNSNNNKDAPIGTRDLLPMIEKAGQANFSKFVDKTPKIQAETAQMTIFYAGQIIVLNDFSAEKAKQIMALAGNSCGGAVQNHRTVKFIPTVSGSTNGVPISSQARKLSVARFLEKRKDRVSANAPYQTMVKSVKAEPWLGLAPLSYPQMQ